ncbi:hypothetical protein GCM10009760_23320 [Kitasatospora kazusensis]|uniref:Uncharacterized protein n=1 Tax=Kitasatospora kazusensis TaxID=407974 RepID=A0ABN2ZCV2_9ACTN
MSARSLRRPFTLRHCARAVSRPVPPAPSADRIRKARPADETAAQRYEAKDVRRASEICRPYAPFVRYARCELLASAAFTPEYPLAAAWNSAELGLLQRASVRIHSAAVDAFTR